MRKQAEQCNRRNAVTMSTKCRESGRGQLSMFRRIRECFLEELREFLRREEKLAKQKKGLGRSFLLEGIVCAKAVRQGRDFMRDQE